jgi:hypothetical protein
VSGDPVQLQQLLLNLISNACDAMQEVRTCGAGSSASPRRATRKAECRSSSATPGPVSPPISSRARSSRSSPPRSTASASACRSVRKIAHAHGGTLAAQSREGNGAASGWCCRRCRWRRTVGLSLGARYFAYVDKILKGAKPADLPVEEPTRYEMIVNLKTAKALGDAAAVGAVRAEEVIE